jgi:hypothetical protein
VSRPEIAFVFVVILAVLEAMSMVLAVILEVFEVTRVSRPEIAFVFVVILAVFDVIRVSKPVIAFVFAVILAVLEVTRVSNPAKELVIVVMLDVLAIMLLVFAVILFVFASRLFDNTNSAAKALLVSAVIAAESTLALYIMLAVLSATSSDKEVMLTVFDAINVGNVAMVEELTPPTLFTVGKSAVPPKSLVNFSLPLFVASASGVKVPPTMVETNAVVAN